VRKTLGHLRYDIFAELSIINDLYRGDLRLYKNFLQPVMKLVSKERIGGSLKRKYDIPKAPYQRLMDSGQISGETRKQLKTAYLSLNPAQLKRARTRRDLSTGSKNIGGGSCPYCQAYEPVYRHEAYDPVPQAG
jgi:hypothetical protein